MHEASTGPHLSPLRALVHHRLREGAHTHRRLSRALGRAAAALTMSPFRLTPSSRAISADVWICHLFSLRRCAKKGEKKMRTRGKSPGLKTELRPVCSSSSIIPFAVRLTLLTAQQTHMPFTYHPVRCKDERHKHDGTLSATGSLIARSLAKKRPAERSASSRKKWNKLPAAVVLRLPRPRLVYHIPISSLTSIRVTSPSSHLVRTPPRIVNPMLSLPPRYADLPTSAIC